MLFVFFKQKTAYEMRISDWSSDVCSSDLFLVLDQRQLKAELAEHADRCHQRHGDGHQTEIRRHQQAGEDDGADETDAAVDEVQADHPGCTPGNASVETAARRRKIGRAHV